MKTILVLLLCALGGLAYWQHGKIRTLQAEVQSERDRAAKLQDALAAIESAQPGPGGSPRAGATGGWMWDRSGRPLEQGQPGR